MASVEPETPKAWSSRGWRNESGLKATADHHILNVSGFSITTDTK